MFYLFFPETGFKKDFIIIIIIITIIIYFFPENRIWLSSFLRKFDF